MVFFLSKAFVSAIAVIVGALLGIKTFHQKLVEAKDPVLALPDPHPEESLIASSLLKPEVETMNVGRADSAFANDQNPGSSSQGPWPECVGKPGQECKALIEEQAPDVKGNVFIVPHGSMVTMDYRTNRVRVFVDEQGVVVKPPSRG